VSLHELTNYVSFFCSVGVNDGPVHNLCLGESDAISEVIADGLPSVAPQTSEYLTIANPIYDHKYHSFVVRENKYLGGRPARKRLFAAG
jgi:hypothetical protein